MKFTLSFASAIALGAVTEAKITQHGDGEVITLTADTPVVLAPGDRLSYVDPKGDLVEITNAVEDNIRPYFEL